MKPMFICMKADRDGNTYISQAVLKDLLEKTYEAGVNDTLIKYDLIPLELKLPCEQCKAEMTRLIKNH